MYIVISGCPSIVPGASAGVIYSPNFPRNYPNISCDWFIRVPYGEKININFSYILPYGDCKALVKIYDTYSHLKRRVTLCTNPFPFTYSESIHVRYNARFTSTSFLVFYQIGYYVPTYAPPWYTTQSYPDCQSNSKKSKLPSILLPSGGRKSTLFLDDIAVPGNGVSLCKSSRHPKFCFSQKDLNINECMRVKC